MGISGTHASHGRMSGTYHQLMRAFYELMRALHELTVGTALSLAGLANTEIKYKNTGNANTNSEN